MKKNESFLYYGLWCIIIFLIFQLAYFNRFLPVQDGWFIEYAKQMQQNKLPYKDFYVFIQPVYLIIFKYISNIFGYKLIIYRYYGLLERTSLIIIVYLLFSQIATAPRAALLTLIGLFTFIINTNDVIYSYYQLVAIFIFTSAYFLIKFYQTDSIKFILASGVFAGLAFMTKQSTGALFPLSMLIMMIVLYCGNYSSQKKLLLPSIAFIVGLTIPIGIILLHYYNIGLLDAYINQIFINKSSKGSLFDILFGFWLRLFTKKEFFAFLILALAFLAARTKNNQAKSYLSSYEYILLSILTILSFIPWLMQYNQNISMLLNFITTKTHFFYIVHLYICSCFFVNLTLLIQSFFNTITRNITNKDLPNIIILVTSFTLMYSHGMSFVVEAHATILSSGILFNYLLNKKTILNNLKDFGVYLFMTFIIMSSISSKQNNMYEWWGWQETQSWKAKYKSINPLLEGFLLKKHTRDTFDDISTEITTHTSKNDYIYTYPHIPIFYLLANREHNTFSAVHYYDVCPDNIAKLDTITIKKMNPKMIIYMDFPKDAKKFHEIAFRGNHRSGQRDLEDLIYFLQKHDYKIIKTYPKNKYHYKIIVLLKENK